MATSKTRFPIRFDTLYGALSTALFMAPSQSYVEVLSTQVTVRMGWGFRAAFPTSAVASVSELMERPISRGVHGFAGKWLVNGSGESIVTINLEPPQRAYVMGFPVKLRQLMVSIEDPETLIGVLSAGIAAQDT